jgi:translation initiation factor 3 subunit C
MSRFFRGGDDSSTESSSDEEELYSEEEEEEKQDQSEEEDSEEEDEGDDDEEEESEESSSDDEGAQKKGASRFLFNEPSESGDESDADAPAKVRSAKDKRYDELELTITAILNGQKINDWGSISGGMLWFQPCLL